eukprot:1158550-Pelagomonas_calceolata.AAC.5
MVDRIMQAFVLQKGHMVTEAPFSSWNSKKGQMVNRTERSSPSKRCMDDGPKRGSSSPSRAGSSITLASGLFMSHSRRVFLTCAHQAGTPLLKISPVHPAGNLFRQLAVESGAGHPNSWPAGQKL